MKLKERFVRANISKLDKFLLDNVDVLVRTAFYLTAIFLTLFFINVYFPGKKNLMDIHLFTWDVLSIKSLIDLNWFAVGVFTIDAIALTYYTKKTTGKWHNRIINLTKYMFLASLIVTTLVYYNTLVPLQKYAPLFMAATISFGFATFLQNRKALAPLQSETRYKKSWHDIAAIGLCLLFLGFGLYHLGQFMSVDEPKWLYNRVPQLYDAIEEGNWEDTSINDKPGVLPAALSGITLVFLDQDDYGPSDIEHFLFWWRFPVLLFNFFMLFLIYHFSKSLFDKHFALILLALIALNPMLIGISQIVNPDATLWSTGFVTFLTFFLYLKTNRQKYIWISGFFFALALLSKYFILIFYVLFFIIVILEYLSRKDLSIGHLYDRLFNLIKLYIISLFFYAVLFPVTWVQPERITQSTIFHGFLSPGYFLLIPVIVLLLFDIALLKGKLLSYARDYNVYKISYLFLSVFFLAIIAYLLTNLSLDYQFFDLQDFEYGSKRGDDSPKLDIMQASFYRLLFTLTWPLLIGMLLFFVLSLAKPKKFEHLRRTSSLIFILIFIIGSALGGFVISHRYQVLLYPIYAFISAGVFSTFKFKKTIMTILMLISFLILMNTSPFYLLYTNELNVRFASTGGMWGFGGYEAAQRMNSLPNAKNLTVWADKEGFENFFVGTAYWRSSHNPFDPRLDVDYLVLTESGSNFFTRALNASKRGERGFYPSVASTTPILEYYGREPYYEFCIRNNENYCLKIVEINKSDLRNKHKATNSTGGNFD